MDRELLQILSVVVLFAVIAMAIVVDWLRRRRGEETGDGGPSGGGD